MHFPHLQANIKRKYFLPSGRDVINSGCEANNNNSNNKIKKTNTVKKQSKKNHVTGQANIDVSTTFENPIRRVAHTRECRSPRRDWTTIRCIGVWVNAGGDVKREKKMMEIRGSVAPGNWIYVRCAVPETRTRAASPRPCACEIMAAKKKEREKKRRRGLRAIPDSDAPPASSQFNPVCFVTRPVREPRSRLIHPFRLGFNFRCPSPATRIFISMRCTRGISYSLPPTHRPPCFLLFAFYCAGCSISRTRCVPSTHVRVCAVFLRIARAEGARHSSGNICSGDMFRRKIRSNKFTRADSRIDKNSLALGLCILKNSCQQFGKVEVNKDTGKISDT
jgi:hypothetical protein